MTKSIKKILIIFAVLAITAVSCKKDDPISDPTLKPDTIGKVKLEFDQMFGTAPLIFGTNYVTTNGDTLKFDMFNYYLSNIAFTDINGNKHQMKDKFVLVKHDQLATHSIVFDSIKAGVYTSVEFSIGVDSIRNQEGAQTGVLDPANGMFWSWNTGYIFVKAEGSLANGNRFRKHVGGFKAPHNAIRHINLGFNGQQLVVTPTKTRMIHFNVDVSKMFSSPHVIDMAITPNTHHAGERAMKVADNCANMFKVDHLH